MKMWSDINDAQWRAGFGDGVAVILIGEAVVIMAVLIGLMIGSW